MTLKSSFRLSLNKINVDPATAAHGTDTAQVYNVKGELQFRLVVAEETGYMNFVVLSKNPEQAVYEEVKDFLALITRQEYVSLTYNSIYIDENNNKVILRPFILPCYSFEFDLVEQDMIQPLKDTLEEVSDFLGFLTVHDLHLTKQDYQQIDNGKYFSALDALDKQSEETSKENNYNY